MISSSPIGRYFIGILDENNCIKPTFFGPVLTVSANAEIFSKPDVKYQLCTADLNNGKYNQYTEEDLKEKDKERFLFSDNMAKHVNAAQNKFPGRCVLCERMIRDKHVPGSAYSFTVTLLSGTFYVLCKNS